MSQYNFKNSGRSIEELNKKIRRQDFLEKEQKLPIGIVLPLRNGTKSKETLFSMTHDENEQVKINLIRDESRQISYQIEHLQEKRKSLQEQKKKLKERLV